MMLLSTPIHIWTFLQLVGLCFSSALPDLRLPAIPRNVTVYELGPLNSSSLGDRPTVYGVPGTGIPGVPRVTLSLDWHLAKLEQHETMVMLLRTLNRIVDQTIKMTAGDEPLLNGVAEFRSSGLRLKAQDSVLLGGFTYGVLAASVRGLGELLDKWGAGGVDVRVYANGRHVGYLDFDFLL
ncbi:MAG: hypothetical protein Q9186_004931 [Xanthomendoza sp. 1 TL-2023]